MPHSLDFDWYKHYIYKCSYLEDAEEYLDEAAEDPTISIVDYMELCCIVNDLRSEGKIQ